MQPPRSYREFYIHIIGPNHMHIVYLNKRTNQNSKYLRQGAWWVQPLSRYGLFYLQSNEMTLNPRNSALYQPIHQFLGFPDMVEKGVSRPL